MSHLHDREEETDVGRALIEELLRTALTLGGVIGALLDDLPEDAFPGEDNAAVLLEMCLGSARPAISAAGEAGCREATALIGAVRDRAIDDLRGAAELAGNGRR